MKLEDKFIIPPFSVFDTKQSYWQDRKRFWLSLGIRSEIGRGDNLIGYLETATFPDSKIKNKIYAACLPSGFDEEKYGIKQRQGTSIFDPVLCEICYKWFIPKGGSILDPFAGGSVRGIVAAKLGFKYIGIDLNTEQIEANKQQRKDILGDPNDVAYINGDSDKVLDTLTGEFDFIFSCPPYHDLEIYGDDPQDLSNMTYEEFLISYESIIKKSLSRLKENRFAIFTVGDLRDDKGFYKNFVEDTVKIFERNGARKCNIDKIPDDFERLDLTESAQADIFGF